MDLLDPLTSIRWNECIPMNLNTDAADYALMTACFSLGGELYMAMPNTSKIYRISADLSSWKALKVPSRDFALTTYRNQLVLLGGLELKEFYDEFYGDIVSKEVSTDKVWVSDNGEHWDDSSLPPLTSRRVLPAAVNTGKPEFLVVIGGGGERIVGRVQTLKDTVEVLVDCKECEPHWVSLDSLPWKFAGVFRQPVLHSGNLLFENFYCKLEELKAECEHVVYRCKPQSGARHLRCLTSSGNAVRRPLNSDLWKGLTVVPRSRLVISYRQRLLGITQGNFSNDSEVMVFSPLDDDPWISIGTVPGRPLGICAHSTGDIVLLSGKRFGDGEIAKLFSATVRGGVTSLNKQCVYVIMSALLENESLDPDQLPARLPDYVPPSVKHYLTRALKTRVCMSSAPPDLPSGKRRRKM